MTGEKTQDQSDQDIKVATGPIDDDPTSFEHIDLPKVAPIVDKFREAFPNGMPVPRRDETSSTGSTLEKGWPIDESRVQTGTDEQGNPTETYLADDEVLLVSPDGLGSRIASGKLLDPRVIEDLNNRLAAQDQRLQAEALGAAKRLVGEAHGATEPEQGPETIREEAGGSRPAEVLAGELGGVETAIHKMIGIKDSLGSLRSAISSLESVPQDSYREGGLFVAREIARGLSVVARRLASEGSQERSRPEVVRLAEAVSRIDQIWAEDTAGPRGKIKELIDLMDPTARTDFQSFFNALYETKIKLKDAEPNEWDANDKIVDMVSKNGEDVLLGALRSDIIELAGELDDSEFAANLKNVLDMLRNGHFDGYVAQQIMKIEQKLSRVDTSMTRTRSDLNYAGDMVQQTYEVLEKQALEQRGQN